MNPRAWVVLLAAIVTVGVTARLGVWQLDRAAQKVALQAARDARGRQPPLTTDQLAALVALADGDAGPWYRKAVVTGHWMADETIYLENRTMNGRPGFFVLTPLLLADGRAVVVQRGWLPRDPRERTAIVPYRTATGRVQVAGRIAPTPSRLYELGAAAAGPIRQNLDLTEFARETRRALLPLVIVQEGAGADGDDGLARQWPEPASDVHKHYGYAFQWFGLSSLATLLYVWFQIIRPRRRARR